MLFSISGLTAKEQKEQKEQDKMWAQVIKNRDNWACCICGSIYGASAHHIIENKDFRYCFDNGITLCCKHHKFSRQISAHNNPLAFFMWLDKYKPELAARARIRTREMLRGEIDV